MGATANPLQNIFPGNPRGAVSFQLIEPSIEFFALRVRQRDRLRRRGETLPELLKEAQAFLDG